MGVHSREQDFADRFYKWFGGAKHFSYLVKMAKQYGVWECDQAISIMKHDYDVENRFQPEARIRIFHNLMHKLHEEKKKKKK